MRILGRCYILVLVPSMSNTMTEIDTTEGDSDAKPGGDSALSQAAPVAREEALGAVCTQTGIETPGDHLVA